MKILKLRFKNLNSLVGEWQIDFTADEYKAEGIYAITGPTGAGKTTILDAICLALYGKTPRLEAINKNSNEIMSRQTAECFSEVIFSTSEGVFLCHWGQHKARKKVEGNLVQQRHEISSYDQEQGQLLEEKSSLVPKVVEEKTGLSFTQFTRSILLAQGNFDTFLKAESDKRAPILEQITGTEIYSQISISVYERWKIERESLNKIKEQAGSVEILSEEAEAELTEQLAQSCKDEQIITKQLAHAQKSSQWHQDCAKLSEVLTNITAEELALSQEKDDFSAKKSRLSQAQKAAKLEPLHTQLSYLQKAHKDKQALLETTQAKQLQQNTELEKAIAGVQEAQKQLSATNQQEERLRPLITQARELDTVIAEKLKQVQAATTKRNQAQESQETLNKEIHQAQKSADTVSKHLQESRTYLEKSAADKVLISELTAIEERLRHVEESVKEGTQLRTKLESITTDAETRRQQIAQVTKDIHTQGQARDRLKRQIFECETDKKQLLGPHNLEDLHQQRDFLVKETQYIAKIIRLEDERQHLIDGKACPLCGATSHPFASADTPELAPKEVELEGLKQRIARIEKMSGEIQSHTNLLHKEELRLQALISSQEQEQKLLALRDQEQKEGAEKLESIKTAYKDLEKSILSSLPHLELDKLPSDRHHFISGLRQRRGAIIEAEEQCQNLQLQQQKKMAELEGLKNNSIASTTRLTALIAELNAEQEELEKTRKKRSEIAISCPQAAEQNIADQKEQASKNIQAQQNIQTSRQETVAATLAIIATSKKSIATKEKEMAEATTTFSSALSAHGFSDKESFVAARLSAEELATLEKCATDLVEKEISLKTRKEQASKQLNSLKESPVSANIPAEDAEILNKIHHHHKEIQEGLGRLKEQLAVNSRAKEKIAGFQQQLLKQTKEFSSWEELYNIIGSADGKKFRNFAQGLSFEQMVNHANRQLIKMTDRYLLTRDSDPKNPLGLQVVDNYQAGEIRSTKNLSGGESFIISLALALGLSHMASQKVRVDSLFLDEGFGTLDSEALETALTALANLQREDKLIGVISHISSLKERIPTQIEVQRMPGGKSTLRGPGCSKM